MRLLSAAACMTVAVSLLAACSGNGFPSNTVVPGGAGGAAKVGQAGNHTTALMNIPRALMTRGQGFHGRKATASEMKGMYAQEFEGLVGSQPLGALGYTKNNSSNAASICNVTVAANGVNGIGVNTAATSSFPMPLAASTFTKARKCADQRLPTSPIALGRQPTVRPSMR